MALAASLRRPLPVKDASSTSPSSIASSACKYVGVAGWIMSCSATNLFDYLLWVYPSVVHSLSAVGLQPWQYHHQGDISAQPMLECNQCYCYYGNTLCNTTEITMQDSSLNLFSIIFFFFHIESFYWFWLHTPFITIFI